MGNLVGDGRGFAADDNEVVFVCNDGVERLPRMSKEDLAHAILDAALER